jgi:probable addiction module antidote protein
MAEAFRSDPTYAADFLDEVLADGEPGELLVAMRQLTRAFGGVPKVAERARLNRTQLYRTLSPDGNPELRSLMAILATMGLRLAVRPTRTTRRRAASR